MRAGSDILAELCKQMSFMLGAGVTIKSVVMVLAGSQSKNRYMQSSFSRVLEGIMEGESLSGALEDSGYFPEFMCSMCRIGEMSDNLPGVMAALADYYQEMARSRDEIKSALLYPFVVAVLMLAMILIAVLYVLPHYALMFAMSDVPLPVLTQALLNISAVLMNQWWLVLPVVLSVIITVTVFVRSTIGRSLIEYTLLYLPPISKVYRNMVSFHIVQAMSLLLQSGQSLLDAVLAVSSIVPNKRVARDLQQVAAGLQEGTDFWQLLDAVPYIDPAVSSMARVGEETGNMAEVFEHASEYSRHKSRQISRRLNKLVEPSVTLVLGLLLGLVMLSIILPTFAMTELVSF